MKTSQEIESALSLYYGTEQYHRASIFNPRIVMTDGVLALCEMAECYWLIDIISSYQNRCMADSMLREMQIWTIKTNLKRHTAVVKCLRDTNSLAFRQRVEYTDFPLQTMTLWVERGTMLDNQSQPVECWVILLPPEH